MAPPDYNTEEYDPIFENDYLDVVRNPLSTFSIDVDAASYSNARRFIVQGQLPPKDAVRIEEFINYFNYDYPQPRDEHPFAVYTELAPCPWNPDRALLHIGLQGKAIPAAALPPSNLVFLLDVSGSMDDPYKLPLLKSAFQLLVEQLGPQDRIAIVVYAGAAGQVLPSTSCDQKEDILAAIHNLEAGGSTAGGEGLQLAYEIAAKHFLPAGNNRIILATDGDFNVGPSSDAELVRLIEEKRKSGIFLSVLGFGSGNYKDAKMEKLADHGNGNFYYIDNMLEAKKVLVSEMGGTLLTIAKDVKIQVEFNPAQVARYRLIGYENRLLQTEDFANDRKDAGELGAGHSVTALYELELTGTRPPATDSVDYRYQTTRIKPEAFASEELAALRLRYKQPSDTSSQLLQLAIPSRLTPPQQASADFRFAAAVAAFGLVLRQSAYKGSASFEKVLTLATPARGDDRAGYRDDFIRLVGEARAIAEKGQGASR